MRHFVPWILLCAGCATAASPPPADSPGDAAVVAVDAGVAPDGNVVVAADAAVVAADAAGVVADGPAAGACGTAGAPTGVLRKNLTVDGKPRSYLLSVPAGYKGAAMPLVFAWHGLGGSGMFFRAAHGIEAPAQGAAIFVYPDALPLPSFGNATGWDLRPDGPDLHFFDAVLADVTGTYCVDRSRVFSMGHSFGGYMTNTLGCLRGAVLRAIAPVAGGLPMQTCMNKPLPAWLTHGSNDPVVAFAEGEAARDHWRQLAACAATTMMTEPAGCVAYDACTVPVHWCVHQRMHDWPPFASAAIWKFFSELK